MTPFARAAHWHAEHVPDVFLADILDAHYREGACVFSTPDVFLLVRQVCSAWPLARIRDPWLTAPHQGDTWHVWLFSGSLEHAAAFLPFWLPWTSYDRDDRLRRVPTDALLRRLSRARQ